MDFYSNTSQLKAEKIQQFACTSIKNKKDQMDQQKGPFASENGIGT